MSATTMTPAPPDQQQITAVRAVHPPKTATTINTNNSNRTKKQQQQRRSKQQIDAIDKIAILVATFGYAYRKTPRKRRYKHSSDNRYGFKRNVEPDVEIFLDS